MIELNGNNLDLSKFRRIVFHNEKIKISKSAMKNVEKSYSIIKKIVKEKRRVYGVTTGFGKLVEKSIPLEKINELQINIIRSHSVGVGEPFDKKAVKGAILLRINTIIRGNSGVSPETLRTYINMLNKDLYPYVPQKGSVGASGDLAPLSHIALSAIGEGEFIENGKRVHAKKILKKYKIKPVILKPKEGLALINGTQMMTSLGAISLIYSDILLKTTDIIAAVSVDALKGTTVAFKKNIQEIRSHKGQIDSAKNLINLLKGSEIRKSHLHCNKVQDAYSLRCIPQVHGASREAYFYAKRIIEKEMNSSTDNPLVFLDTEEVISGGNFHGQMIAIPLDTMKMAISEIANISDRRTYRLIDEKETGLYPFLTKNAGLNSGFMMMQVTGAALVSENKILSHPASVDSIPTSLGQEDHVSMGTIASRKLYEVIENTAYVLAIELFAALMAIYYRKPLKSSKAIDNLMRKFFKKIKPINKDRAFYKDMEKIKQMILNGEIINYIEEYIKLK